MLRNSEQIPLFRLRYGGSAHSFGFAIHSPARDRYDDAILLTGLPTGSPQEALDTACTLHLTALGHEPESWPPTNLRCHRLSVRVSPFQFVAFDRTLSQSYPWSDRPSLHCVACPSYGIYERHIAL